MSPARREQIKEMFYAALGRPVEQRAAFLRDACAGDEELRGQVESLLATRERAHPSESDADSTATATTVSEAPQAPGRDPMLGRSIGPYRVLSRIGSGGMGAVYLAVRADQQFDMRVAIKVVYPGRDHTEILERFRLERQTLAALDHPNVVKLLDGGTTAEGHPYLVMDYVAGVPISEYCRSRQLDLNARLRLFLTVCGAVEYAHRNLVVHRDIKPGNILVTGEGACKLLDFGIAKVLRPSLAGPDAEITGNLRPMTIRYASPEQIRGGPITVATDIYSLGVLLYELAAGRHPFEHKTGNAIEVARAVCEEEPLRPSVASSSLAGDLDAIVLTAMHKEPERRYRSVRQFAEDLERHLDGLPVTARPQTWRYRAEKFAARHKAGVAAGVAAVLLFAAGIAAIVRASAIARAERARAERRFHDTRDLANALVFDVFDAIKDLRGSAPARRLAAQKGMQYIDSLAGDSSAGVAVQLDLVEGYLRIGDLEGNPYSANRGDPKIALESFGKALRIAERAAARDGSNDKVQRALARSRQRLGELLPVLGKAEEGLKDLRAALTGYETLARAHPADAEAQADLATCYSDLADLLGKVVHYGLHDLPAAEQNYRKSQALWDKLAAASEKNLRARRNAAVCRMRIADLAWQRGDTASALEAYLRIRRTFDAIASADPSNADARRNVSLILQRIGESQTDQGHWKEGLESLKQSATIKEELSAADPSDMQARYDVAVCYRSVGELLNRNGQTAGALTAYGKVTDIIEQLSRAEPANTNRRGQLAEMLLMVASLLDTTGQKSEARRQALRGLEIARALADRPGATAGEQDQYAQALLDSDPADVRNPRTAVPYAERAVSLSKGSEPIFLDTLARAYHATGDKAKAIATEEKALALAPATPGQPASSLRRMLESHAARFRR